MLHWLVVVDQHAAHERLVYERMKAQLEAGGVARQALLLPEVVELDPTEAERVAARAGELEALGLVVENLLRVRFGELDPEIQAIISRILQLSPEEFTPLLLHCSKQQLLKRFPPEKSQGN